VDYHFTAWPAINDDGNDDSVRYLCTCWSQQPVVNYRVSTNANTNSNNNNDDNNNNNNNVQLCLFLITTFSEYNLTRCQYRDCMASMLRSYWMRNSWWNDNWKGKLKYWEKPHPSATLSTIDLRRTDVEPEMQRWLTCCILFIPLTIYAPITVNLRHKARNAFSRTDTGIVGLNPTRGIDVCLRLFYVCFVLCK
jgi:hypothetical protein